MTLSQVAAAVLLVALSDTAMAAAPTMREIRALAGSCSTASMTCNSDIHSKLESGDCLFSDGSRFDTWDFDGRDDQIVEIVLRPLASTFTSPWLTLISPLGDPSEPPVIHGGLGGVTLRYRLTTTGRWRIAVSSDDVFAGGDYVLEFHCDQDNRSAEHPGCVEQDLLCGQEASWSLNADSCKFSSAQAYAQWQIYGIAGDFITFEQTGFGFEPLFGIYRDNRLLQSSARQTTRKHTMQYVFGQSGWYSFATTTVEPNKGGDFDVKLTCSRSGCIAPLIMDHATKVDVKYGEAATLALDVHHVGPIEYRWYEFRDFPTLLATTPTPQWQTPPVTSSRFYYMAAVSPCGTYNSDAIRVSPKVTRRRSAGH